MFERYQPDLHAYVRRVRRGPCFVCAIVSRDPDFPKHHVFVEDTAAIAFLNTYPTQYGSSLVAPKEHKEQVAHDFTVVEYLGLQRVVHRAAEAVREEVGAERFFSSRWDPTRATPTSTGTSPPCRRAHLTKSSSSP